MKLDIDSLTKPFLAFSGKSVIGIRELWTEGCLDKVILSFRDNSLVLEADSDYDSIRIYQINESQLTQLRGEAEPAATIWAKYINQPFGWGWVTVNQQNFPDGVILSFDGIEPNILLNVIASSLHIYEVCKEL